MKILIVNTEDISGGAARAAYRLHRALIKVNVDSQMLVQRKTSDDFTVLTLDGKVQKLWGKIRPTLDSLFIKLYKNRTKTLFSSSFIGFTGIVDKINDISPDIVHLHWICSGIIKIEDLAKIKAPIVWSLHDMWVFTGGCHYDDNCGNYKNSCGNCRVLGSEKEHDLSRKIFNRKEKIFSKIDNITIIGLSHWLKTQAKESTLFKNKEVLNLSNPIDTDIFKPFDKVKSRELWNLPQDKKLILFGAIGALSDPRKGFDKLSNAITKLKSKNIELVVFGSSKPKESQSFGFKTHYLGSLYDDVSLVTLYSAVDVMIVPSLQENLSNAIMESLSCATPVVGFNIGGNGDMIEHLKTGYLATPFDATNLADGIEWILNSENYNELCKNAREKVLKSFDSHIVAQKYIKLYEGIIGG